MRRLLLLPIVPLVLSTCTTPPRRGLASVDDSLNSQTFLGLIQTHKIATVAETLSVLAKKYPAHLQLRTYMFDSESIQQGSFEEPRVIVFGPTAEFVFTFNGGPHQYGGDAIEAYQFDRRTKEFQFFSVVFKKEAKELIFNKKEIAFENEQIVVTKNNPGLCLGCHGESKPHPIWSNDLNWAGAFGSNDDLLFGSFHKANYIGHGRYEYLESLNYPRSQGRWIDLPQNKGDLELEGYLRYLKKALSHDRYKHLPPQSFENGFREWASGRPISEIDESAKIKKATDEAAISGFESDRINLFFTDRVTGLSIQSLVAALEKNSEAKQVLKQVFSREKLSKQVGLYYPGGRPGLIRDSIAIQSQIDPELAAKMEAKIGPFRNHMQEILKQELEMQVARLKRIEAHLKSEVEVPDGWPTIDSQTAIDYRLLLGRRLTRLEMIAIKGEGAGLPFLGLLSYTLKYVGINLADYETTSFQHPNRGRVRAVAFYISGSQPILDYLNSL